MIWGKQLAVIKPLYLLFLKTETEPKNDKPSRNCFPLNEHFVYSRNLLWLFLVCILHKFL